MKILNGYCGIGGNRKLWGDEHEITAVEINPEIASIYKDFFPNDNVIVGDFHEFLLKNFQLYDFIWSSPPCQSHTKLNTASFPKGSKEWCYPDMSLYQEVILLKHFFYGGWVVENVIPYYIPLIIAQKLGRHLFWTNFIISNTNIEIENHDGRTIKYLQERLGCDVSNYALSNKKQILRNCVPPELGLHILECARGNYNYLKQSQENLFTEEINDKRD